MDAQIKCIDSLHSLSSDLLKSQEAISADCVSIVNFMEDRLMHLIGLRDRAEEIVDDIEQEYREAFHKYAENASQSDNLDQMQADLHEKEDRLKEAKYLMGEIDSSVTVCQFAIQEIESETRSFNNESSHTIDAGRRFLQKSAADLRNLVELSNKK